jgi:hypothetical protein
MHSGARFKVLVAALCTALTGGCASVDPPSAQVKLDSTRDQPLGEATCAILNVGNQLYVKEDYAASQHSRKWCAETSGYFLFGVFGPPSCRRLGVKNTFDNYSHCLRHYRIELPATASPFIVPSH